MVVLVAFAALAAIALLTFKSGRRAGGAAFAAMVLFAVALSALTGHWSALRDASLGTLLGLPVLIAAVIALDHRSKRMAGAVAGRPVPGSPPGSDGG